MLVNHVGISVTDVEKSIEFYRDALGLTLFQDQMISGPDVDLHANVKDGKFRMVLLIDAAGNALSYGAGKTLNLKLNRLSTASLIPWES